jgi:hypothetical protein
MVLPILSEAISEEVALEYELAEKRLLFELSGSFNWKWGYRRTKILVGENVADLFPMEIGLYHRTNILVGHGVADFFGGIQWRNGVEI